MFFRFFFILLASMVAFSHCQSGEKSGTCPPNDPDLASTCDVRCGNDYDCAGAQKCCKNQCGGGQCVNPLNASQPVEKPGTCPANKPGTGGVCAMLCNDDSSCSGNKKCCSNPCGGTSCKEPDFSSECEE